MLLFLNRVKLDVLIAKRQLPEDNEEDIDPILRGIDSRIEILNNVWDSKTSTLDEHLASTIFRSSDQTSLAEVQSYSSEVQEEVNSPNASIDTLTIPIRC